MAVGHRQLVRAVVPLLVLTAVVLCPTPPLSGATLREHYFSDTPGSEAYYFDVAGSLGIVTGYRGVGGPANPGRVVSRAEFAVMVARLLSLDPSFSPPQDHSVAFGDSGHIPTWAEEAVAACSGLGIIRGIPDGTGGVDFCPDETVTAAEGVAMLLRALGNDEGIIGGWPTGYIYRAFETGLLSSEVDPGDWRFVEPLIPLTRAQTVYLLHNALFCWRGFSPGAPGEVGMFSKPSIGSRLSGYSLVVDANTVAGFLTVLGNRMLRLAPTVTASGVTTGDDLVGRRIFWLSENRGRLVFIRGYGEAPPVTGVLEALDLRPDGAGIASVVLKSGRVLTCAPGAVIELNRQRWPFDPDTILPTAQVTAILEGGEAVYVSIMQEDLPEAVIKSIDYEPAPYEGGPTLGTITARISMGQGDILLEVGPDTEVFLDGDPVDLSRLREWDVFYAATEGSVPKKALRIYAYRDRVTARVKSLIRRYTADGLKWQVRVEAPDEPTGSRVLSFSSFCEDKVDASLTGRQLTFCLDRYGRVAYFTDPGPLPGYPVTVKVLGETIVGDARLVTVDWKGHNLTYDLPPGMPSPVLGSLVRIHLSTPDLIDRLEPVQPAYFEAEVVSVDAEGARLTLKRDNLTWTLSVRRVPVYSAADVGDPRTVNSYLPLRALSPGQAVWLTDPGAPQYILVAGP